MTLNTIDSSRLEDWAKLSNLPNNTIQELSLKEDKSNKGIANGYAPLDATWKVPTENLPSTGIGDMAKATYDPENGARQVAFKDSVQTALDDKVDKITGKGLSTEDYTTSEKSKLAGIEAGAQVNTLNDIIAGTNIAIDKTDPLNPVISSVGAGAGDVTASGTLTDNTIILGGGTKTVKSSSKTIVTTLGSDDTTVPTSKAVADVTNAKQDILVSGVNISTINGNSLLVGGNLEISATGGGSGVQSNVYLTNLTSTTVPTYKQTSYTADATETLVSTVVNNNTVLMQSYIFDIPLEVTYIPAGTWTFNASAYVSSAVGVTNLVVDTYLRTSWGVETLLFSVTSPEINNTTKQILPPMTTTQPEYATNTSDQIVTKIKGTTTSSADITITYAVGDGSASYFNTPLPLRASQVRFNSTTNIASTNVQTAIEELDSETVKLTGDQTVSGVKTFSSSPIVPTPTSDMQTSTKKYADDGLATKVPTSRTLTINGTTYDLSEDRSWTISGGGLSWGAEITGTSGTGITSTIGDNATAGTVGYSGVIGNTQTGTSTLISLDTGTSTVDTCAIRINNTSTSLGSWDILIRNYSTAVQANKTVTGIAMWGSFNTNSSKFFIGQSIDIQNNAGTGANIWLRVINWGKTSTIWWGYSKSGIKIDQIGTDGTGLLIYWLTAVNSLTNGLANITLADTQTGASALLKLDGGTSAQGHKLLYIKSGNNSSGASMIKFDQAAFTSVVPMEFVNPDASGKSLFTLSPAYTSRTPTAGALNWYIIFDIWGQTKLIPYYKP